MASRASVDLAEAETYFRKAIKLDPEFPLPYSGLAETLVMQTGWSGMPESTNLPRAEQSARAALQLGPNLAESWAASALVAAAIGDDDRAEAENRKAIALNPNYATAYMRLAALLLNKGRYGEALPYSTQGLDLDPLSSASIFSYARNLSAAGRFDEAVAQYLIIIELDPLRPNTYRDLAMLNAYVRNDFVSAIPFAEKLVDLDPGAPYARCNLVNLYLDLGDHAQVARVRDLAQKRFPKSADVLAYSAWTRLVEGDAVGAERLARQARAIDPESTYSAFVLAVLDTKRGDHASARAHYAKLVPKLLDSGSPEIRTDEINLALDLVYILRMTGEAEQATQLLDRAREVIATMPRLSETGYGIADVRIHALRGKKAAALELLRKAADAGWRFDWRYHRDFDPALASIRDDAEFKAVFADIERDMARQRAELAARPKNAPLDLAAVH
jgi:tetratricopeptide (TPR) repeat protein